jgi:hypothetical protein
MRQLLAVLVLIGASACPASAHLHVRLKNRGFWVAVGAACGAAVADAAFSRACVAEHTCKEMNPLAPRGGFGEYGFALAGTAGAALLSWKLIDKDAPKPSKIWILPLAVSGASHGYWAWHAATYLGGGGKWTTSRN